MKPTNSSGNFLSQFETNSHVSIMQTQTTQTSFESHSIDDHKKLFSNETNELSQTARTTLSNYDVIKSLEKTNENIVVHPPLRVRLQKANEKSVVLKWDHNQLNSDNKISLHCEYNSHYYA